MTDPTGQPQGTVKQKNWFVRHKDKIFTGILILVVIFLSINSSKKNGNNSGSTPAVKEVAIQVTAKNLYAAYTANEIKADEQYKNKLLEVSGVIENIAKDILDNPYVTLNTGEVIGNVQCMLADSEKSKAGELTQGQSIVVEGKNKGKTLNVILDDCIIK